MRPGKSYGGLPFLPHLLPHTVVHGSSESCALTDAAKGRSMWQACQRIHVDVTRPLNKTQALKIKTDVTKEISIVNLVFSHNSLTLKFNTKESCEFTRMGAH